MKLAHLLTLLVFFGSLAKASSKPNVLFLAIDDLNDWIGCLGGHPQVKTPNLDRLAARGTLFTNAHCQAPVCNPSRTSVMLGLRPSTTGIYSLQPSFKTVPKFADHVTIPKAFQANGYATSTLGKIYHGSFLPKGEFDKTGPRAKLPNRFPKKKFVDTPQNHRLVDWGIWPPKDSDQLDYHTAEWAVGELSKKPKDPFFMAVGFFRPHVPLYASQKWFDLYPEESLVLPHIRRNDRQDTPRFSWYIHWKLPEPRLKFLDQNKQLKNKVRSYLASVSFVDAQVGRVLDALEASGLEDNTIVACWSDHGYHLGEKEITGKNTLWDPSTRVPMMFAGPGISKGARCERPAELLDLYPTLAELCQLKSVPKNIEGLSLVPQLKDAKAPRTRPAITSHGPGNNSARSETHRYIRYADGSEELYDIRKDPHEFKNLASDPKTKELRKKLAAYFPKNPAKPVKGSRSRLIERKEDGSIYWENTLIEKDAKIPEYE
ncbi:MAG: sulfatase [Opitutae bacterium]|nr:sulfatase [Opitutae bacterium]